MQRTPSLPPDPRTGQPGPTRPGARRRRSAAGLATVALVASLTIAATAHPATASATGTLAGVAFQDLNRDGVRQAGEAPMESHMIYLFDAAGSYVTLARTGEDGTYSLGQLADGTYRVEYAATTWWELREDWAPTTTGSLYPSVEVQLSGAATADFGWRPIVRSADLSNPLSEHTGPSGVRVRSYIDTVTAAEVHDRLAAGSLLGDEAALTTVYFGYSDTSSASVTYGGGPGAYTGFSGRVWLNYLSWLSTRTVVLFHEYGHVWAHYHDKLVLQDGALTSYLEARGLTGDARLGSSKAWDPDEMIAEDYRQLFGDDAARAHPQANTEIPDAADVAGLAAFLSGAFMDGSGADVTPPSLTDLSPGADTTVSGTVTASVAVTDGATSPEDMAVTILLGGVAQPAAYDAASNRWAAALDTTAVASGPQVLEARATDGAGNSASAAHTVDVANPTPEPAITGAVTGATADGGTWTGWVEVTVVAGGDPAPGVAVTAMWTGEGRHGDTGTVSCVTDAAGRCRLSASQPKRVASITFSTADPSVATVTVAKP